MLVEIEGTELPGLRCGPNPEGRFYENVHVGIRHRGDTIELVPGDAAAARWQADIKLRESEAGIDFSGPYVHGKRGERCLYLRWGEVAEFRAAKLKLNDIEASVVNAAMAPGRRLVGRLGLTDEKGHPRCASVRPPDIIWSTPTPAQTRTKSRD